jgi:hypothetical protein
MDKDLAKCYKCGYRQGIATPVMVVPIRQWPVPAYVQLKGALCQQCCNAFSMKQFTDIEGDWYTAVCDHLRSVAKPAVNPYPNDPDFDWEYHVLRPDWEPAPMVECVLQFWKVETLAAKGMSQRVGPRR